MAFVPSISVIFGIEILDNELHSQIFFIICKFWIFIVPTIWYLKVDKNIFSRALPTIEGLKVGSLTGVGMSIIIIITWLIFEKSINLEEMKGILESKGLSTVSYTHLTLPTNREV